VTTTATNTTIAGVTLTNVPTTLSTGLNNGNTNKNTTTVTNPSDHCFQANKKKLQLILFSIKAYF
ncbi:unnamed protein product, partial [Rotaria sp. Silwood2]